MMLQSLRIKNPKIILEGVEGMFPALKEYLSTLNECQLMLSDDQPYTCDVCRKSFGQQSVLIRHQRIHSGECLYTCDVCSKSFSRKHILKIHLLHCRQAH